MNYDINNFKSFLGEGNYLPNVGYNKLALSDTN